MDDLREPRWLPRLLVDTIHEELIREHGGSYGIRDAGSIDSALSRARNRWAYEPTVDLPVLAAAYGYGLARNHGYVDGNKRVAFMALYVFLSLNGLELEVPEAAAVSTMTNVAAGALSEEELAVWVRNDTRDSS